MGYSDYSFKKIKDKFGIENQAVHNLLGITTAVQPSDFLLKQLEMASFLRIRSEKARSEAIVFPLLLDVRARNNEFFTIYSGDSLNVNDDLKGECDFMLAKDMNTYDVNYPIIQIVEAKKHDIEDLGIPQCAAQLVGARYFNLDNGIELKKIYGCATTGKLWQFLLLEENTIYVDEKQYVLDNLTELLGAFQFIIDYYKKELN
jgi:hypothetical protein